MSNNTTKAPFGMSAEFMRRFPADAEHFINLDDRRDHVAWQYWSDGLGDDYDERERIDLMRYAQQQQQQQSAAAAPLPPASDKQ